MRLRRTAVCAALVALAAPLLAVPAGAVSIDEARRRVATAAGELEYSTAAVRAAAASLDRVAVQLPGARRNVASARGELAGAQARLAEANTKVRRAELATAAAQRRVAEATARVEANRDTIGTLARRSYQQGPLGDLREVFRAGSPQDVVDRAETLKKVFRGQNDVLRDLTVDRLHLAGTTADLAAQQDALEDAREEATEGEAKARAIAVRAEQAAARVAELVADRERALAQAEAARAEDVAEYKAANEASRALAARLRAIAKARAAAAARARQAVPRLSSSGRFMWPTDGPLTSRYGYRQHPIYGDMRFHAGIDIGAGSGSPVVAAADGVVVVAGPAGGYGNFVSISHGTFGGRDITTNYAHNSTLLVREGQRVERGVTIARVGSSGNSTGPHLHFEVRKDGDPTEPLDWVSPP